MLVLFSNRIMLMWRNGIIGWRKKMAALYFTTIPCTTYTESHIFAIFCPCAILCDIVYARFEYFRTSLHGNLARVIEQDFRITPYIYYACSSLFNKTLAERGTEILKKQNIGDCAIKRLVKAWVFFKVYSFAFWQSESFLAFFLSTGIEFVKRQSTLWILLG